MKAKIATKDLPLIPAKRYFTIGEVSELCAVKPHVLRYWEQEFSLLKPAKRCGSRRYYQEKDINIARNIRTLLYDKGFTINGARKQLSHGGKSVIKQESKPQIELMTSTVAPPQNTDKLLSDISRDLRVLLERLKC